MKSVNEEKNGECAVEKKIKKHVTNLNLNRLNGK